MKLSPIKRLLICAIVIFSPMVCYAESVTLRWTQNSEPDLQGYNLYFGTSSRSYGAPIPVGRVTQYRVNNLTAGRTYYFALTAVDTAGNESGYSTEISHYLSSEDPLSANLSMDRSSPQTNGQSIVFTGSADGGSGNYEYAFRLYDASEDRATTVQNYSSDNSWTWNTSDAVGDYAVSVWVRNVGSTSRWDAYEKINYRIQSVPEVSITPNVSASMTRGEQITFIGSATGGSGNYEYAFRLFDGSENRATTVQNYSSDNSWTWNADAPGSYKISVWVRNVGSTSRWDDYKKVSYKIQETDLNASVTPSLPSFQPRGNQITFIGSATGGSGNYEYAFRLFDVSRNVATTVRNYSTDNTWVWDTRYYSPGEYFISIWVRNIGSNSRWEAYQKIPYEIR